MPKSLAFVALALVAGAVLVGTPAAAPPSKPDISAVLAGAGIKVTSTPNPPGDGSQGDVTVALADCASGQVLKSGSPGTWSCAADDSLLAGGTVTGPLAVDIDPLPDLGVDQDGLFKSSPFIDSVAVENRGGGPMSFAVSAVGSPNNLSYHTGTGFLTGNKGGLLFQDTLAGRSLDYRTDTGVLRVFHGYFQFPTISGSAPPSADCDSSTDAGRSIVRTDGTTNLYICTGAGGWVGK